MSTTAPQPPSAQLNQFERETLVNLLHKYGEQLTDSTRKVLIRELAMEIEQGNESAE
jgi:hypothetical protein